MIYKRSVKLWNTNMVGQIDDCLECMIRYRYQSRMFKQVYHKLIHNLSRVYYKRLIEGS